MQKGKIGVTTENIFPIIKKFLYSEHEIFLRELISNAVDATQKLRTLASAGEYKEELGDLKVKVKVDKKKKTLSVSDNGIGMTGEEIKKYINQIAFSSAEEFLDKYKNQSNAIIGHFGLGFYSSFMVSDKVEIKTRSYRKGSKAVHWTCDGSPEYTLEDLDRKKCGTEVILHLDKDSKEFLEDSRIEEMLKRYCRFLPVEIAFGKDNIINDTQPLWTKKPVDLKNEDYNNFYQDLYPMSEEPLFNIHLNVDYPFNLTGILYFPRIKSNIEVQKNKIQLYSNQVFVTDSVEGIVPDFLTLLHGVLDSPDIPLNVSRSYLQGDPNVKKISGHITKKVADRLEEIFKKERKEFEEKWDDLKLFINYGMLSEEKFYDRAEKFALLKNTDDKYFTFEEYSTLIKTNQTDKNNSLVYLYATDKQAQLGFIESAKNKGYDVLLMDGHFDMHFLNHLETKLKDSKFARVDSDIIDKLILKEDLQAVDLSPQQSQDLSSIFQSQLPESSNFLVSFENLGENESPVLITQSEFTRRMKEMSELGGGPNFYGGLPDSYSLVVNASHPLVNKVMESKDKALGKKLQDINEKLDPLKENKESIEKEKEGMKEEEISQELKDRLEEASKKVSEVEDNRSKLLSEYGKKNKIVKQVIDLALLSNNMLKGEELVKFVKRSVDLIK